RYLVALCEFSFCLLCFFCVVSATSGFYTLSLHDALPIYPQAGAGGEQVAGERGGLGDDVFAVVEDEQQLLVGERGGEPPHEAGRSEEHTSELQSRENLVCRLLLEKKKQSNTHHQVQEINT